MNKCKNCGQFLPSKSLRVDWTAIKRAIDKLEKEIGFGIPDEAYKRNTRKSNNNKTTKKMGENT